MVSTLFQLKLQDGGSDGCLCWEPPLCVGDQQPCAKGPRPLLHQVGQASRSITITLYLARKQPFEEKPKLAAELAKPLHSLVMSMNTHPVRYFQVKIFSRGKSLPSYFSFCRIALHFRASPCLLEKITSVRKVLELMSDREFKNRTDVNEVGPVLFAFFAPS